MPRITIERTNTWWDQAYIPIYINDKKVGAVGSGRTAEFNVADGTHKVVLKKKMIGYFKPLMIDLRKNENKTIRVSSFKYGWAIFPCIFLLLLGIYMIVVSFTGLGSYPVADRAAFFMMFPLSMLIYFLFYKYRIEEVEVS